MFSEPLEPWAIGVYPLLSLTLMAWLSWPPTFHWNQVLRWETLLWAGLGIGEIYRLRHLRPGLSRVILIALPLSLSFALFNPERFPRIVGAAVLAVPTTIRRTVCVVLVGNATGDPHLIFWMAMGLLGYLWFLESIPEVLRRVGRWLRKK